MRKRPVLGKYRFAICYENARDIPGYITEKIFDCFFAGCIPVYWGANNITEHIPQECFIDRRTFNDTRDVYSYLSGMDDKTYMQYVSNINSYLRSPASYEFTIDCFSRTVLREIAGHEN